MIAPDFALTSEGAHASVFHAPPVWKRLTFASAAEAVGLSAEAFKGGQLDAISVSEAGISVRMKRGSA